MVQPGTGDVCSLNRFWKVEPVDRNFSHGRSSVFGLMNQVPWSVMMAFDTRRRKLLGRPS